MWYLDVTSLYWINIKVENVDYIIIDALKLQVMVLSFYSYSFGVVCLIM